MNRGPYVQCRTVRRDGGVRGMGQRTDHGKMSYGNVV
jgi:hypothetical protein